MGDLRNLGPCSKGGAGDDTLAARRPSQGREKKLKGKDGSKAKKEQLR